MGQTYPKPDQHFKNDARTNLTQTPLPAPRTYTDAFWRKGDRGTVVSDRDMEALEQFRQLGLESLISNNEKESRIRKFCQKYDGDHIAFDVDEKGCMRFFIVGEELTRDIEGMMLDKYGEDLIIYIGTEVCGSSMYLGGSGKVYIAHYMCNLLVVCDYNEIGTKSTGIF